MIESIIAWCCVLGGCFSGDPQWFLASALFAVAANIREKKVDDND
jgi:hypothetical protein